ncbi:hypothetical protein BO70DRAFT_392397 [Aspergillus heteromorphus CBS 117.55]|uniref:LITAF domain-containing protein n=1 Tax=Aspergillus heteromorphus CBS 117.55 TaxID=1448321 RepID=A0A317WZG3_9EURO|nr:uncharacterized protein BO70DRAFT_392397 [Aspergillus heteromorphus CBS 117.55]PWY90712.1 hypothetical protein BO70DRAFT_392397 [Aspergillus heteromorphus CBS 117.55]
MGSKPYEPTPPYEEATSQPATHTHIYDSIPQTELDDIERQAPHEHGSDNGATSSIVMKPHEHCETCERAIIRRERHSSHRQCCKMVAIVLIVLFICLMILGIVLACVR